MYLPGREGPSDDSCGDLIVQGSIPNDDISEKHDWLSLDCYTSPYMGVAVRLRATLSSLSRARPQRGLAQPCSGRCRRQASFRLSFCFSHSPPFCGLCALRLRVRVTYWILGGAYVCDIHGYAGRRQSSDRISGLTVAPR